jgi:hypothetical protein
LVCFVFFCNNVWYPRILGAKATDAVFSRMSIRFESADEGAIESSSLIELAATDVLFCIFRFLNPVDVLCCRLVCMRWAAAGKITPLWDLLYRAYIDNGEKMYAFFLLKKSLFERRGWFQGYIQ